MNATNAEQSREGPDNGGMPGSASKRGMKRKLESKTFIHNWLRLNSFRLTKMYMLKCDFSL
jgi:hypothetical protein